MQAILIAVRFLFNKYMFRSQSYRAQNFRAYPRLYPGRRKGWCAVCMCVLARNKPEPNSITHRGCTRGLQSAEEKEVLQFSDNFCSRRDQSCATRPKRCQWPPRSDIESDILRKRYVFLDIRSTHWKNYNVYIYKICLHWKKIFQRTGNQFFKLYSAGSRMHS